MLYPFHLDIQLCAVGKESVFVELCDLHDRFLFSLRALEHLILARVAVAGQVTDVGDVHDAGHVISAVTEGLFQNVLHDIRTEVADMGKMINRRTAGIHFYLAGLVGNKILDGFGKCVVQFHYYDHAFLENQEVLCEPQNFRSEKRSVFQIFISKPFLEVYFFQNTFIISYHEPHKKGIPLCKIFYFYLSKAQNKSLPRTACKISGEIAKSFTDTR